MRILVVDDQEHLRAILRDFFAASGYTVIEAADGAESVVKAVSQRRSRAYGHPVARSRRLDATRQISSPPGLAAIPIIAVSCFAMKGDEEKAHAAGCDHYVTKPYSPIQLLRIIQLFPNEGSVYGSASRPHDLQTRGFVGAPGAAVQDH
jgi:two-component system cell cycle response regulator DivK